MNDFFDELRKDRLDTAEIFKKPSVENVKSSIVDKYSDQAHFVYELLQNADDTGATRADFQLYNDKLIFKHNGARHFSISDPNTEKEDTARGTLGDLNAITSVANSNKTSNSIGKFGVGFKAVFQYTETPEIYDRDFSFRIEDFWVPCRLDVANCPVARNSDETVFVFPFNKKSCPPAVAFREISAKLQNLEYPILFLSHLRYLTFEIGAVKGFYKKVILESRNNFITEESIRLSSNNGVQNLILFSQDYNNLRCCVGYFLRGGRLNPVKLHAFCFFPTKVVTGLNFIIHAPFLLTDSREGIKVAEEHNKNLIKFLADLAANSLFFLKARGLIDDNILDIIPYDRNNFGSLDSQDKISFLPFYEKIKTALKTQQLIPANGFCVHSKNAYWAEFTKLTEIFSNEQLAEIVPNKNAAWVFTSKPRDKTASVPKDYIDDITQNFLDENAILKGRNDNFSIQRGVTVHGITAAFIEKQPFDWLHKFYKWLSETDNRTRNAKILPLFLDSNGKATVAFANSAEKLFLPSEGSDYPTVHPALLENPETKKFLVEKIGLKIPAPKDEIENKIFPKYDKFNKKIADDSFYFKKIFNYYLVCPHAEISNYLEKVKQHIWLRCSTGIYMRPQNSLYIPAPELKEYFTAAGCGNFVAFNFYLKLVGQKESLIKFFKELGLFDEVQYFDYEIDADLAQTWNLPQDKTTQAPYWHEMRLEGCVQILNKIRNENSPAAKKNLSLILWKRLVAVNQNVGKLSENLRGFYEYFYYSNKKKEFEPILVQALRGTYFWLADKAGKFKTAKIITAQELADEYNLQSPAAQEVLKFLEIAEKPAAVELSAQEKKLIAYGKLIEKALAAGTSLEDIKNFLQKNKTAPPTPPSRSERKKRQLSEIQKDIEKFTRADSERDADDLTPPSVNYQNKIERLKQKTDLEQEKLERLEELQQKALDAEKYSFGWFKACLELEILISNENRIDSKEISISFGRVEMEPNSSRTLILKYPSRFIPQYIEDLENIPLNLKTKNSSSKVAVEVVSVRQNTLRVKLKSGAEIRNINLAEVQEASINAQNPIFLLGELHKQFLRLPFEDNFNLRDNLCKNIEFIFGPPGTGKTTYLAEKVILPLMQNVDAKKILVLTPTNKAADVLTRKIMNCAQNYDWLIRFGTTDDEIIEREVFKDKTFDIRTKPRNVTVTTIARFPYDFFLLQDKRLSLCEMNWDFIIIDEASMIPLINIILPLYKKQPAKFFIAGDPFQIEPVISLDLWKGENIYTLVELKSFTAPKTLPHNYKVTKLQTQYRSLPSIGEVFSRFTYGGILKHYRREFAQRPLNINSWLKVKSLNIIKFPVRKYESVYRSKKINNSSSYQSYSAIFTFEFVREMCRQISKNNPGKNFNVGIIAPYRVQADLIDKLFAAVPIPLNIQISAGTIHGLQGDECDIVVAVFNPPPSISRSPEMFLNRRNIINVSISRARDYLFLIMPDNDTENIQNLILIKQVEKLFGNYGEFKACDIENLIFKSETYIEDNSFSTGHQNVNIYTEPEKIYEIRSDDNAVDIQIIQGKKFL